MFPVREPFDPFQVRLSRGFTLIEMSIVLVIIGLLVGGVLVGRDLIHAAEVRATVSDIEKLKTSINTFRLKYNCLPGDCSNATDYFGTASSCPLTWPLGTSGSSGTCNGNGDGSYANNSPWYLEANLADDHLAKAGLWPNSQSSYYDFLRIRGIPDYGFAMLYTNDTFWNGAINGRSGNSIVFESWSQACLVGVIESAIDSYSIDAKIDDGKASTGAAFGLNGAAAVLNNGVSTPPGCGGAVPACLNGANDYDIVPADNGQCRMLFYW